MNEYYLEFNYNEEGMGKLIFKNGERVYGKNGLQSFEIEALTGRYAKGNLRNAIKPGKYDVIKATKNVLCLNANQKIATQNNIALKVEQALEIQGHLCCYVNMPLEPEKEKQERRFQKWIRIFMKWIERD